MVVENSAAGEVAPEGDGAEVVATPTAETLDVGNVTGILGLPKVDDDDDAEQGVEVDAGAEPDGKPAGKKDLPPEIQAAVDRRIGKEVAKRKDLEARLQTATAKLSVLEAKITESPAVESRSGILGRDLTTMDDGALEQYEDEIRKLHRWARRYQATGFESEDGQTKFTAAEIQDRLEQVEEVLESKIPKAKAGMGRRKEADDKARKAFPAMFDPTSADAVEAEGLLKMVPELRRVPEYRILIGAMLEGFRALKKRAPAKQPAPAIPIPGNKPSPSIPGSRAIASKPGEAVRKYVEGGQTMDALAGVMKDF